MTERMARVETNIDNIKEDVSEIKKMLEKHIDSEIERYEDMNKRFAPKWVQPTLVTLLVSVALAALASLIRF